jgi:hypothetical protein
VPVEECTADGSRFRVSGWRLDALLPGDWFRTGRGELVRLAATFEYRADRFDNGWR